MNGQKPHYVIQLDLIQIKCSGPHSKMEQVEGTHIVIFVKFCKQHCASPWERNCV